MKKILKLIIALSCMPFFSGAVLADTPAEYDRYNFAQATDFERLAFGFPQPIITIIPGYGDMTSNPPKYKPVVILAGGYDPTKDYIGSMGDSNEVGHIADVDPEGIDGRNPSTTGDRIADKVGNAIYFVDAMTGALVARVRGTNTLPNGLNDSSFSNEKTSEDMKHSIAATITPVDSQGDGITDRIYFVDVIGNIFRLDLIPQTTGGFSANNWNLNMFASLGTDGGSVDRRFFHQVDVVRTKTPNGFNADALLVGSGNIALPKEGVAAGHNAFFMIYDQHIAPSADLSIDTPITTADLDEVSGDSVADVSTGWYLPLGNGEKVVSASTTVDGAAYFTTIVAQPETVGCQAPASLPTSYIYGVNMHTAGNAYARTVGDGSIEYDRRSEISGGRLAFQQIEPFVADGGEVSLILPDKKETLHKDGEDRKLEGDSSYWRTIEQ